MFSVGLQLLKSDQKGSENTGPVLNLKTEFARVYNLAWQPEIEPVVGNHGGN